MSVFNEDDDNMAIGDGLNTMILTKKKTPFLIIFKKTKSIKTIRFLLLKSA